jgi:hypothetical protein
MRRLTDRISKLEASVCSRRPEQRVERHIVAGASQAEREAKIAAIVAGSDGNVLHICRVIVEPTA